MLQRMWIAGWVLTQIAGAQPSLPARGWDSYQVIMWSTGSPASFPQWIERLRELGFTAEQCTGCNAAPYAAGNFGFYVENMVPELAYLHSREALYNADFAGYTTTRDKSYLVRKPGLHDEDFWGGAAKRSVQGLVRQYAGQQPLLYQLRDELSIGRFANPMDYCFGTATLRAFRTWLESVYGSLDALNQEWDTTFSAWDDVVPLDTYEIKDRERAALAAGKLENYAPWADHRAFMDLSYAQTLDRLRGYIREFDIDTPVGIEGTQMPSAWGGFDIWRMSRAIDWVEAYDIAGAREVWRSFLPPGATFLSTVFGDDFPHIRQRLWRLLLHGDRGAIVWDDEASRAIQKDQAGMPLTDRGRGLAEINSELRAIAPQIYRLNRVDDRIAIHYSQASIRAHWMFDSREDRDTWPRRFSSYEATYSRFARVRDSFMRVIEDLGLQYNFVSYEQIEKGELLNSGYKVLLLPQSVAISAQECRRIEEFVRAGGTVIADNMTATMDEHGRRLAGGQLDDLLGIRRTGVGWRARPAGGDLGDLQGFEPEITVTTGTAQEQTNTGVPVIVVSQVGDGRAVYLNLDMHNYGKLRLVPPGGSAYRDVFAALLKDSGLEAAVKVVNPDDGSPVPCTEVWRYTADDGSYVAIMRNPEFSASSLKAAGYPDNSNIETPARIRLIFDRVVGVTDVRSGEDLGAADQIEADLDPWSPVILRLQDIPN